MQDFANIIFLLQILQYSNDLSLSYQITDRTAAALKDKLPRQRAATNRLLSGLVHITYLKKLTKTFYKIPEYLII